MSSFSTPFLKRWQKFTRTRLYTIIESKSEGDEIQEHKDVDNVLGDTATKRRRWSYAVLVAALWLSTAAIFSMMGPAIPKLLQNSRGSPQWFPDVPTRTYVFDTNDAFAQEPTAESNAAWDSLMPPGRGRVVIEKPWIYNLSSIFDPPLESEEYGISVFHQLHCLGVLRYSWFALLGDQDPSIEQPARYRGSDGKVRTAHGWGVEHQCKDWDGVWKWTMKYHAHDNRSGIL